MAREARKDWQQFKKDHPEFEKNKTFKSDLGPTLDKADKLTAELRAGVEQLYNRAVAMRAAWTAAAGIVDGYTKVPMSPQAKTEIKQLLKDCQGGVEDARDVAKLMKEASVYVAKVT